MIQHSFIVAFGLIAIAAAPLVAGDEENRDKVRMDQLSQPASGRTSVVEDDLSALRGDTTLKKAVPQLPSDIDVVDEGAAPENDIREGQPQSPELVLYAQVAEVWSTLRAQGLQPTPELIAREIGPDTLSQFLTEFPGAEAAIGSDAEKLPEPDAGSLTLPDGTIIVLPNPQGG